MSLALYWATQVTSVGLEFALPALAGYWLDGRWPLKPLGVIGGAILGFAIGILHLVRISRGRSDSGSA